MTTKPKKPRKPRPSRAKHPRGPGDPKRGPMPWKPSEAEQKLIELYTMLGADRKQLSILMGKSEDSLETHARAALDKGMLGANFQIAGALFSKAMGDKSKGIPPDLGAIVWWEKTRSGKKDISRFEHTGADGKPLFEDLSDEEVEARIAARIAELQGDEPGTSVH